MPALKELILINSVCVLYFFHLQNYYAYDSIPDNKNASFCNNVFIYNAKNKFLLKIITFWRIRQKGSTYSITLLKMYMYILNTHYRVWVVL